MLQLHGWQHARCCTVGSTLDASAARLAARSMLHGWQHARCFSCTVGSTLDASAARLAARSILHGWQLHGWQLHGWQLHGWQHARLGGVVAWRRLWGLGRSPNKGGVKNIAAVIFMLISVVCSAEWTSADRTTLSIISSNAASSAVNSDYMVQDIEQIRDSLRSGGISVATATLGIKSGLDTYLPDYLSYLTSIERDLSQYLYHTSSGSSVISRLNDVYYLGLSRNDTLSELQRIGALNFNVSSNGFSRLESLDIARNDSLTNIVSRLEQIKTAIEGLYLPSGSHEITVGGDYVEQVGTNLFYRVGDYPFNYVYMDGERSVSFVELLSRMNYAQWLIGQDTTGNQAALAAIIGAPTSTGSTSRFGFYEYPYSSLSNYGSSWKVPGTRTNSRPSTLFDSVRTLNNNNANSFSAINSNLVSLGESNWNVGTNILSRLIGPSNKADFPPPIVSDYGLVETASGGASFDFSVDNGGNYGAETSSIDFPTFATNQWSNISESVNTNNFRSITREEVLDKYFHDDSIPTFEDVNFSPGSGGSGDTIFTFAGVDFNLTSATRDVVMPGLNGVTAIIKSIFGYIWLVSAIIFAIFVFVFAVSGKPLFMPSEIGSYGVAD